MSHPLAVHFGLAVLALASLWAQMTYRIPGRSVFWALPWLGPAVACLGPLLLVNTVAGRISASQLALRRVARWALVATAACGALAFVTPAGPPQRVVIPLSLWGALVFLYLLVIVVIADVVRSIAPPIARRILWWIERVTLVFVAGFIVVGLVAFVNGRFDTSAVTEVKTHIRDIGWTEIELERALEYGWADLRSWRKRDGVERIFLTPTERTEHWPGQAIVVHMRAGALRLPWVVGLAGDVEEENLRTLAIAPNARAPRAVLIDWYLQHHRWQEATLQTLDYVERFPSESEYVRGVAANLGVAHQNAAARQVLERLVVRHRTPEILGLTGWVLHITGDKPRSLELLGEAIRLDPDDWINYYRLGNVFQNTGRYDDAIRTFEQMLERRPHYPEVERQLGWLRDKVKQRGPSAR
jgi:uncharacterized membrane protein